MHAMGEVLRYRPPRAHDETTAYLGMVIFLASWAMMFAALFFAYGYVRSRALVWPPPELPALPIALPLANTLVLGISSAVLQFGNWSIAKGSSSRLVRALGLTVGLGILFLVLQLVLWSQLYFEGLRPSSGGPYGSVFYGLTCFHALHVAVGLGGLVWLWRKARLGTLSAARHLPLRLWTMYWHFVGVVWALMLVSIFLV
jgi:cytochrome c oxidase subunit 3